jgi:molybdenum cofactor synthesis domain-containing protein
LSSPARAAVISISTSRAGGKGIDVSGERLAAFARGLGLALAGSELIADERALIEARLRHWSDVERCSLILTTGGTGLSPSDRTPEATRAVIEREVPGIGEAMRLASRAHTPNWMLSRATAGLRGSSLIINFPGSPASIDQTGEAIAPAIGHALSVMSGEGSGH